MCLAQGPQRSVAGEEFTGVFVCGFILISINNKVKKSTILYKIVQVKDEYSSDFQKYCIFVSMPTIFGCIILMFQRYFTDRLCNF